MFERPEHSKSYSTFLSFCSIIFGRTVNFHYRQMLTEKPDTNRKDVHLTVKRARVSSFFQIFGGKFRFLCLIFFSEQGLTYSISRYGRSHKATVKNVNSLFDSRILYVGKDPLFVWHELETCLTLCIVLLVIGFSFPTHQEWR